MSYIIYHKESTFYMPGMKSGGYKSKGAATRALNETTKKWTTKFEIAEAFNKLAYRSEGEPYAVKMDWRDARAKVAKDMGITEAEVMDATNGRAYPFEKSDYAIAETTAFHYTIEKMVTRINLMSGKEYKERANTPISCSPAFETYWSM